MFHVVALLAHFHYSSLAQNAVKFRLGSRRERICIPTDSLDHLLNLLLIGISKLVKANLKMMRNHTVSGGGQHSLSATRLHEKSKEFLI
jgi:hypothetical protein